MSSVVMQAAEFETVADAERAEAALERLEKAYIEFERTDPSPWSDERVPPPLAVFGEAHGVEWPLVESSRFLLEGRFGEEARLLRVDRMVFFWGPGFELGGETLRMILQRMGAVATADFCKLVVKSDSPDVHLEQWVQFLIDEDFEDQFEVASNDSPSDSVLFSVALEGTNHVLAFDDSGVRDWAFVTLLPQLAGMDPRLIRD
jgi:hypothetical protein